MIRGILIFSVCGSVAALLPSALPGQLNDLLFIALLLSVCWLPVGAILMLVFSYRLWLRYRRNELSATAQRELMAVPVILFLTLGLLVFYVPRRVAFRLHRPSFDTAVPAVPVSGQGVASNRRIGIYTVDQWAADPRGGTYFRVHVGGDGLGPDQISYGFVKNPNTQGTPFGRAKYRVYPLHSGWYWFHASNDW